MKKKRFDKKEFADLLEQDMFIGHPKQILVLF